MLKRVVGQEVSITPTYDNIKVLWITIEDVLDPEANIPSAYGRYTIRKPSIWFKYIDKLYYGICKSYTFHMFETYDDWVNFNPYEPSSTEVDRLFTLSPIFFEADPIAIFNSYLGSYCDFELKFIKEYQREISINKIIK